MNYKEKITDKFNEFLEFHSDINDDIDYSLQDKKLLFLSMYVFDFVTYSESHDLKFSKTMMDVIKAIYYRTTFQYVALNEDNYLLMVNMPFLRDKLNWGTGIRSAWFDDSQLFYITFLQEKILNFSDFIKDLIDWFDEN